jgi:hypothetical protein
VGYQRGRGGGETTLSERLPCGRTGAFSSGAIPSKGETVFEGRMQDGTITTESSHSRMGSAGRTPAGCHFGLGTGVHTLQSCSIYSHSHVLGHGRAQWIVCSHVLGFLPPPYRVGCSRLEESGSLYLVDPIAIIEV